MYKTFIHYGCSFTYGQDSGGDGIDDPDKSYPAYLSKFSNNDFVNRANPGASLEQIALTITQDLNNLNSDIHNDDVLVIINLTSALRIMSSVIRWWTVNINERDLGICNINPVTPLNISPQVTDIHKKLIHEKDWVMYFSAYNILNSISNQLEINNKNYIFVDVLLDLNQVVDYFPIHKNTRDKCITFGIKGCGIVRHIANQGKKYKSFYSKSQHYYATGYRHMAELVFDKLKEKALI